MLLTARILTDVSSANKFRPTNQYKMTQGDAGTLYFQLVDASLDTAQEGFNPAGRRYIPAVGATLSIVIDNIDDSKKITRAATNPFSDDRSIWALSINSSDTIKAGTAAIKLTLTEGAVITRGILLNAIGISSQNNG